MLKNKEMISIIIPSYKRKETLKEAILSVVNQTYKNFEIIVVNDCGIDTKFIVDEIRSRYNVNIKYFRHEKNKGLAATRNTGIKNAKGQFIAFLDDDDLFYPNHLETLYLGLKDNPNFFIAYTNADHNIYKEKDGELFFERKEGIFNSPFSRERFMIENYIPVNSFLIRKEIFDKGYYFDESLRVLEDYDLWIRLSREYEFLHIPEITSEVRNIDNSLSDNRIIMYETHLKIFKKYKIDKNKLPFLYITRKKFINEINCKIFLLKNKTFPLCSMILYSEYFNNLNFHFVLDKLSRNIRYPNLEIILISPKFISDFYKEEHFTLIKESNDNSFSKIFDKSIITAKGEYIFFLYNVIPLNYGLTSMVLFDKKYRCVGMIGGKTIIKNYNYQNNFNKNYKFIDENNSNNLNYNKIERTDFIITNNIFFKKEDYLNIGRIRGHLQQEESLRQLSEKIKKKGYKIYYNPFSESYLVS